MEINDRDGYTTNLDYDLNNQLTGIHYGDGRQVGLNYNPQGYVTGMTDWLGTNSFELDPLGRIKKVTDFAGRVQQFTWTATGQKESIRYPDDSRVTYSYDSLDRLTGVTDAFNRTTSYLYNPADRLVETQLPNGSKTVRDYDDIYRIISLTQRDPGGKITDSYRYEYDPAGNKTAVQKCKTDEDELEENEEKTYAYDALNQLVSVSEANGSGRSYYYDTLGNRVAMVEREQDKTGAKYYRYDSLNRLTGIKDHDGDVKDLSYDNRGNLTEIRSGDRVFNTYSFDAANRLIEAVNKFGDKTSYTYDGLGRRIQVITDLNHGAENNNRPEFPPGPGGPPEFVQELKNKNPGPPSHAGNPKPGWGQQFNRHYMAQHNVVDYTKAYDILLMSYGEHSQIQRYTYGLELTSMDFIALDYHDNGWIPSGTETAYVDQWDTLYYQHDDLGTVNKVIGSSGKTSAHYNYDEFGRPLGAVKLDPNWSGPDNAISYTGYTYDHFAELYYAQARYYQPEVGRFISQDPWAGNLTKPGTLNPYPYVLNNPLGYVDPLGLQGWACPQANSSGYGLNGPIGLSDWIKQVGGSVSWDSNTRVATATYNGIIRQYDINNYDVQNNRIMVDLDQLLEDFNYVPNEKPVEVIPIWDDPIFYISQGVVGLGRAGIQALGKTAVREGAELVPEGAGNATRETLLEAASNPKLKNAIDQIYRPGAKTGDGGLADAIRHELQTGELVGGKSHLIKGQERVRNLENILKSQNLSPSDQSIAEKLLNNLKNALGGN